MIDWARGEWHAEVKNGKPQGAKAGPWKGCVLCFHVCGVFVRGVDQPRDLIRIQTSHDRPYHNARAIMLCLEELRRGL